MAIVIPSKNIYKNDNEKLLDNQVSGVDVEENKLTIDTSPIYELNTTLVTFDAPYQLPLGTIDFPIKNEVENIELYNITSNSISINRVKYRIKYTSPNIIKSIYKVGNTYIRRTITSASPREYSDTMISLTISSLYLSTSFSNFGAQLPTNNDKGETFYYGYSKISDYDYEFYADIPIMVASENRFIYTYKISFQGETLPIEQISNAYGSGKKLSIGSNELMQNTTTKDSVSIGQYLSQSIITSYKNGKENATIKCSVNNYYNEDNTIAKSITDTTKSMVFEIGDKVIPMIPTPNGDTAMSKKSDGTAKVFNIVGTDMIYDGAVWQTIILQEVTA